MCPVSMSLNSVTTLRQWFTCVRLPDPHLTPARRLFHIAHHDHVTALAACGGLEPPPAGRLRRAKPSSLAQHCFQNFLHAVPFAFVAHGLSEFPATRKVPLNCGNARGPPDARGYLRWYLRPYLRWCPRCYLRWCLRATGTAPEAAGSGRHRGGADGFAGRTEEPPARRRREPRTGPTDQPPPPKTQGGRERVVGISGPPEIGSDLRRCRARPDGCVLTRPPTRRLPKPPTRRLTRPPTRCIP